MVKQKAPDSDIMKSMAGVMAEMTKQQMQLQGAGATAAVEMQSKASGVVFDNMLKTMKELMANQSPVSGKEDSTLEKILSVAGPLLANMQQNQPAQPMPAPPQNQPAIATEQPVTSEPARKRAPPRARPAQPAAQQPPAETHTPAQRIRGSLHVLRRMTITGESAIPPHERWQVLNWVRETVPDDVRAAIASGDKEQVILLCSSAAVTDPHLINWLKDTENVAFVEDAIADIRAMIEGKVTEEHARKAIDAQMTFLARRVNAAQASVAATAEATTGGVAKAATAAANAPIAGPGSQPPAAETAPPPPPPPPSANRPRARRAPPAAPPADNGAPPASGG
jgi:hypothetical protein